MVVVLQKGHVLGCHEFPHLMDLLRFTVTAKSSQMSEGFVVTSSQGWFGCHQRCISAQIDKGHGVGIGRVLAKVACKGGLVGVLVPPVQFRSVDQNELKWLVACNQTVDSPRFEVDRLEWTALDDFDETLTDKPIVEHELRPTTHGNRRSSPWVVRSKMLRGRGCCSAHGLVFNHRGCIKAATTTVIAVGAKTLLRNFLPTNEIG
mmetsp:Transcript_12239/g.20716  ORF Transcript_12239/g.20716 Transcript_12239/m.20716 type:complete len:205 (-) Transcript_12239:27-641(-)